MREEERVRNEDRPSADEFLGAHAGMFLKARPSPILGVADQPWVRRIEVNVKKKRCKARARLKARANSLKGSADRRGCGPRFLLHQLSTPSRQAHGDEEISAKRAPQL
jgi:hypothetical protein